MKEKINLKLPNLTHTLADLKHSVQFLKVFCFVSLLSGILLLLLLFKTTSKEPLVITVDQKANVLSAIEVPKIEDQVREGVKAYLSVRYTWAPKDINSNLTLAEQFISSASLKSFRGAMESIKKFSIEKEVSQRVYPDKIEIDLDKKSVLISGDRITSISGLRAAGSLNLVLEYDFGARTKSNPWGIYFSKEKEEIQ